MNRQEETHREANMESMTLEQALQAAKGTTFEDVMRQLQFFAFRGALSVRLLW